MIKKASLVISLLFFSTFNCFASNISSFDAISEEADTKITICLTEKQNFKISNNQKSQKLLIEFENMKNSYQFGTKDVQQTTLIKDIHSRQDGNNTTIFLNTYSQAKIEDFEFNNKTRCLNLRVQSAESVGILNNLKKENMPWFAFEQTKDSRDRKITTKLVKKSNNPLISPLKDFSKNIHKVQKNLLAAASNFSSSNKNGATNLIAQIDQKKVTTETISTKPYQITKVSDNFSATASMSTTNKYVIVLDPGHGGQDYGSVNRETKTKEKDLTLKYARNLKIALEKTGKYKVFLTRDSDEFLPLLQRTKAAARRSADLFLSIHADGIETPNLSSVELYSYSSKASDGESEKLARLENASDYMIANANFAIEAINYKINPSKKIAQSAKHIVEILGGQLSKTTNTKIKTTNHANFIMLKNESVPSILIELGFASQTEKGQELLVSKSYMQKINNTITSAINEYFESENK